MAASENDMFMKVAMGTATTMSSPGYTIGNTTINVGSTAEYPSDSGIFIGVDEVDSSGNRVDGTYNIFRCKVASATQFSGVTYVGGDANRNYSAGATTRVYQLVSYAQMNRLIDGILTEHNQDGTHGDVTATSIVVDDLTVNGTLTLDAGATADGWQPIGGTLSVSTGYNKGQKEFDITSSTDLTAVLSPGMRLKVTRGTTPPTQCTDLESSSSQYANRVSGSLTGITFTDDFTVEAWVKLESYTQGIILGRRNGTSGDWRFYISSDGRVSLIAGSTSTDQIQSYQSIPLNRWVHVAASLDMSGATGAVYIDGVSVPGVYTNGAATSLAQSGELRLGTDDTGGNYFDGKISDVRLWNVVRTATQIRDNMNQQLVGTESNLIGYWKLAGNFNDSTSNANNLTAQNSAAATSTDNPMNATEYAIITKVTASTITVFTGTDYEIPNMTLSNPSYSTQKAPFGFPTDSGKWQATAVINILESVSIGALNQWFASSGGKLNVPTGAWTVGYQGVFAGVSTVAGLRQNHVAFESSAPTNNSRLQPRTSLISYTGSSSSNVIHPISKQAPETITSQTTYTVYGDTSTSSGSESWAIRGDLGMLTLYAECAYV